MKNNLVGNTFTLISSTYVSLIDGMGCTCNNCGRLIANIVKVKNDLGDTFTIGQDCAKTILKDSDNKLVDRSIKQVKRDIINAPIIAAKQLRTNAINDLMKLAKERGHSNENINTPEGRAIFNECIYEIELKYSIIHLTYRH